MDISYGRYIQKYKITWIDSKFIKYVSTDIFHILTIRSGYNNFKLTVQFLNLFLLIPFIYIYFTILIVNISNKYQSKNINDSVNWYKIQRITYKTYITRDVSALLWSEMWLVLVYLPKIFLSNGTGRLVVHIKFYVLY